MHEKQFKAETIQRKSYTQESMAMNEVHTHTN